MKAEIPGAIHALHWAALESTRACRDCSPDGLPRGAAWITSVQHHLLAEGSGYTQKPTGDRVLAQIGRVGSEPPNVSISSIFYDGRSLLLHGGVSVFLSVPRSHP